MAKENLCEEYERLSLECEELRNQLRERETERAHLGVKLGDYDKFRINLIGEALAELITAVSGRKFVYDEVNNTYYKRYWLDESDEDYDANEDCEYRCVESYANIVVAHEKYQKEYYSETTRNKVEQLIEEGDAILLKPYLPYVNYVSIYQGYSLDVEKFGYVKDFSKALIQYCYERDIKEATKEDINACLTEFLENYKKEHAPKGPTLEKVKGEN